MENLKREYVVPLRRKFLSVPKWRRTKRAISTFEIFMKKHMKCENIVICAELNQYIWKNGAKNPPGKVSVTCEKIKHKDIEKVIVNLSGINISKQLDLYKTQIIKKEKEDSSNKKDEVKDIKVEEKKEEVKVENGKTN